MKNNRPKVDIFVPVYNEQDNIEELFNSISEKVHCPFEVMIVYDSDDDGTLPVIERIKNNYTYTIRLVKNKFGRGALNAFRTGMDSIENDYIVFTMADLSDSLETINTMYDKLLNDNYDLVAGSRYIKGGSKQGGAFIKNLFSRCAGMSLQLLTGMPMHDISNGFKMYKKYVVESIKLESSVGFEIGVELAVKTFLAGYRITEVPAGWCEREGGMSQFKMWSWIPHYLRWYFFAIRNSWFVNSYEKQFLQENSPT